MMITKSGFTRINNAIMRFVMRFTRNYNGLDTVEIDGNPGGGDYGWHYDTHTGLFRADDDAHVHL